MNWHYGWHREVQEIKSCMTCGVKPCVNPRFCRACRIADEKRAKKPPTIEGKNDGPAQSTIDADNWALKFNPNGERAKRLRNSK